MKLMRYCLCILVLAALSLHAGELLNGKLTVHPDGTATIEASGHKSIQLSGDETTTKVLADPRVNGFNVQVRGHFTAPDRFQIDPSFQHSLLVHSEGKLKLITYWCDV